MKIGILGAMQEEVDLLQTEVQHKHVTELGGRRYYTGDIGEHEAVVVFSYWGKAAAASTVTTLLNHFEVDAVIFTGVAGALSEKVDIGDIVIGSSYYQHDLDASPIFLPMHIPHPVEPRSCIVADKEWVASAQQAAQAVVDTELAAIHGIHDFVKRKPRVVVGAIASGDEFISSSARGLAIRQAIPDVLCVEMEGAAVAQVCDDYDVPFVVIRTISDRADHHADIDFPRFVTEVASQYADRIIRHMLL